MKQARSHKSEKSGKEAPRLFYCNYSGKWITRDEVKAERVINHEHRLISKQSWSNMPLRKSFLHAAQRPPHPLEHVVGN